MKLFNIIECEILYILYYFGFALVHVLTGEVHVARAGCSGGNPVAVCALLKRKPFTCVNIQLTSPSEH